jgi:GxxExxY protein
MELNDISEAIIGAAIEVHRELGPGLLESTYEQALAHELGLRGISCECQLLLPLMYKDLEIPDAYRLDMLVEGSVIVELKTVASIQPIHQAQLLTYLKTSTKSLGLLINFHTPLLREGIKRMVNDFKE